MVFAWSNRPARAGREPRLRHADLRKAQAFRLIEELKRFETKRIGNQMHVRRLD